MPYWLDGFVPLAYLLDDAEIISCPYELKTVRCGSLIFSVPIETEYVMKEYERDGIERKFPYCDYELVGKSPWNYAYCSENFSVERQIPGNIPFSSIEPPVRITADVRMISWEYEDGYDTVCAKQSSDLTPVSDVRKISLHPYGTAKLRMTQLPFID